MRAISLAAAGLVALMAVPAVAQTPPANPPVRVRGTVDKLDGQTLMVKSRDGSELTIALAPDYKVAYLVKRTLADIKPGDYVASAGVKAPDGKIYAVEVRIFPQALRGVGEGQYPWDQGPDSVMTNATVTGTAQATTGEVLTVSYKGKTSDYIVKPDCPVFGYAAGDASLLKPGAAVFVVAQKKPDGTLTAARITAEKDGIKPPM
jgi:hypothetical protein